MTPVPITVLLSPVPPNKLTMSSLLCRFPPHVSTGFTFIPLMVITVMAIVVSMDPMVIVIVVALPGVERSSPESHRANQGRHQNKRTEVSVYSHVILIPFFITVISAAQREL